MIGAITLALAVVAGYGLALLWKALTENKLNVELKGDDEWVPSDAEKEVLSRFEHERIGPLVQELTRLGFHRTYGILTSGFGNIILAYTKDSVVIRVMLDRGSIGAEIARAGTHPWNGTFRDLGTEIQSALQRDTSLPFEEIAENFSICNAALARAFFTQLNAT